MSDNIIKPTCVFQSPVFTRSGYGGWALSVAKSLLKYDKFDLKIVPTPWGNTPRKTTIDDIDKNDSASVELFNKILRAPMNKQPDLFIQMTIPNEFQPMGKYNIGMTAGIETTIPNGDWVDGLNRMNMNIVTSKFSKDIFESSKFVKQYQDGRKEEFKSNKPMEVCFWSADTNVFKKTTEQVESVNNALSEIPEKFAYLFVGAWTNPQNPIADRKDIGNLIKTFCAAFKDKKGDKPCLILKTNGVNYSKVDKDICLANIKNIRNSIGGDLPNVYLLHGELTDIEMNALYNHDKVKIHISFTHGEGFGHPLLLATLSGKPLLAPNWSGHLDFLNPQHANLLDGIVKQVDPSAVNQWIIKESSWFNVSYNLAEEKIKNFYYTYNQSMLDRAEKLRLENVEKFNDTAMDSVFNSILDKYVPEFSVEKKIVLPSLKRITLPKLSQV
jgi:hypothetical protein